MDTGNGESSWHFFNRQRKVPFDEGAIREFLEVLAQDLARGSEFSVVVSSDEALRHANRQFRNVRRTTDVLSFPDGEDGYLGDLLISAPRAARQAAQHGHSIEEEIRVLALHGMLHLRGYDHARDEGEMDAEERRLRERYGLASGLIERCSA